MTESTSRLEGSGPRPDALSLVQFSPEDFDRGELVLEVRRLRLRLEALRAQRDERIDQLRTLEARLQPGQSGAEEGMLPLHEWRRRAELAEETLAALLQTRSMRALRVPRQAYGRLLAARARRDSRPTA